MTTSHDQSLSHAGHAHDHGGHRHFGASSSTKWGWALALVLGFMVIECLAGWFFHSLALLSDGIHMFSDAASLAMAGGAAVFAKRRASARRTYGYKRLEVLAAFANALSLLWLSLWIGYEAVDRIRHPVSVDGPWVLLVAILGLAVNLLLLYWLHRGEGEKGLNEKGVIWHVLGDTLSSVAAIAAGAVITWTGWSLVDPLLTFLVVGILILGSFRLLLQTGNILVEGAPQGLDSEAIRRDVLSQPQVAAVHDLHLWSMDGRDLYASAHISTQNGPLSEREISQKLTRMLAERHHLDHITLQVGHCGEIDCTAHCGEP